MTILEAVYTVLKDLNLSTDDSRWPLQYIYRKLKSARAELIRQDYNKGEMAASGIAQTLECVTLKKDDSPECGDLDLESWVITSCKPLPNLIESDGRPMITAIYTQGGGLIRFTTLRSHLQNKSLRFKREGSTPSAFIVNDKLHVVNYDFIDCLDVFVEGFFYNPEEVDMWNNPDSCMPVYDRPFDMPEYLFRRVARIVSDELRIGLGIPTDLVNNSKEDIANAAQ